MADDKPNTGKPGIRGKQLGQLLIDAGELQMDNLGSALNQQELNGGLIGRILQEMRFASATAVATALLKQVQITDIPCETIKPESGISSLLSRTLCDAEKLCPFERLGNVLCVVMANPLNRKPIQDIEAKTSLRVKAFKAPWPKISELIARVYATSAIKQHKTEPIPSLAQHVPVPVAFAGKGGDVEVSDSSKRAAAHVTPQPKRDKKVIINVDLDKMDLTNAAEVIGGADEPLVELPAAPAAKTAAPKADVIVRLQRVEDSYFYIEAVSPPGARTVELQTLINMMPRASVVAGSIAEFDAKRAAESNRPSTISVRTAGKPIEVQLAPTTAMAAVPLTDAEFQSVTAKMAQDPVGEWDWQHCSPGPVAAQVFEE